MHQPASSRDTACYRSVRRVWFNNHRDPSSNPSPAPCWPCSSRRSPTSRSVVPSVRQDGNLSSSGLQCGSAGRGGKVERARQHPSLCYGPAPPFLVSVLLPRAGRDGIDPGPLTAQGDRSSEKERASFRAHSDGAALSRWDPRLGCVSIFPGGKTTPFTQTPCFGK